MLHRKSRKGIHNEHPWHNYHVRQQRKLHTSPEITRPVLPLTWEYTPLASLGRTSPRRLCVRVLKWRDALTFSSTRSDVVDDEGRSAQRKLSSLPHSWSYLRVAGECMFDGLLEPKSKSFPPMPGLHSRRGYSMAKLLSPIGDMTFAYGLSFRNHAA